MIVKWSSSLAQKLQIDSMEWCKHYEVKLKACSAALFYPHLIYWSIILAFWIVIFKMKLKHCSEASNWFHGTMYTLWGKAQALLSSFISHEMLNKYVPSIINILANILIKWHIYWLYMVHILIIHGTYICSIYCPYHIDTRAEY